MTALPEGDVAQRVATEILDLVSDVLEQVVGRNPLADKVLALAVQFEKCDPSSLVGPHAVAAKLRGLVSGVRGG